MQSKQPLIVAGSARQDSNTLNFALKVFTGRDYKLINLLDYHIEPYNYEGTYIPEDEFAKIAAAVLDHDTIVFATPVYWYAMSASMKTLFDRLTDLVTIQKTKGRQLKGKSILLLATGTDPELPPGFEIPFQLTADYLDMIYKGSVYSSTEEQEVINEEEQIKQFLNKLTS